MPGGCRPSETLLTSECPAPAPAPVAVVLAPGKLEIISDFPPHCLAHIVVPVLDVPADHEDVEEVSQDVDGCS